jgi:hypothetical protein
MKNSKLKGYSYYYISLFVFSSGVSILFLCRGINLILTRGFETADIWKLALFISLILIGSIFVNFVKILRIQPEKLRYYSLFHPFGKTLYFKDYIGVYKTTETGSEGTYDVVYLVDKNNITRFKIMGLYYKNMDEIIAAIPLPEIKKNLSAGQYFKLMFTGRANLSKIKPKNKSKKTTETTENKIGKYMRIFIAVAFLIFVITMIIRIISKL